MILINGPKNSKSPNIVVGDLIKFNRDTHIWNNYKLEQLLTLTRGITIGSTLSCTSFTIADFDKRNHHWFNIVMYLLWQEESPLVQHCHVPPVNMLRSVLQRHKAPKYKSAIQIGYKNKTKKPIIKY